MEDRSQRHSEIFTAALPTTGPEAQKGRIVCEVPGHSQWPCLLLTWEALPCILPAKHSAAASLVQVGPGCLEYLPFQLQISNVRMLLMSGFCPPRFFLPQKNLVWIIRKPQNNPTNNQSYWVHVNLCLWERDLVTCIRKETVHYLLPCYRAGTVFIWCCWKTWKCTRFRVQLLLCNHQKTQRTSPREHRPQTSQA